MVNGIQIQPHDGRATPYHRNSTKHIPSTWSMSFKFNHRMVGQHPIIAIQPSIYHLHGQWHSNSTTGWWGNTLSSQFNQAYTIYMVNDIQIQPQDGGATPYHRNSTKHIPSTWSMTFKFNHRMVGQHPIIAIQPSIYHLHGQWHSNSTTGW